MAEEISTELSEDGLPEDFEVKENEDGSAEIIPPQDEESMSEKDNFYENLVEKVDSEWLKETVDEMLGFVETDKESRKKRDEQYADAIRRSGLGDDAPGGAEFEGASRVVHPMIAEAAIDFQASAIKELFPVEGAVKMNILGKATPEKFQKADRKRRHMNWQLKTQIKEFEPSLEQILSQVPMGGVQYSKMYYWERAKRPKFEYVPLDDIFIPFHAASFRSAQRKTHRQRLNKIDFEERIASGLYLDPEEEFDDGLDSTKQEEQESKAQKANDKIEGKEPDYDEDGLRTVYEIYCWMEVPDDQFTDEKYKYCPYILTIDESTEKALALYRNWDPELETYEELEWIVDWPCIPWRGAYDIGLSHLIGSLGAAATGALRALLDSAHINNAPTAIKLKGAQMSGQSTNISVTQIHEIDAAPGVDDIRKIAMPLPFNPPSTVLFSLLGFLTEAGRGMIRTAIENSPEYSPNIAPGTQLSMVEQGLKVYSAIHKRLHSSFERVLRILHRLNKDHLEDEAPDDNEDHTNDWDDEINEKLAYRSDYEGEMDVAPVSDPNIFSDHQRYSQMGAVGQLMDKAPQIYDVRAYHKRMLQLMKVPAIEELLPEQQNEFDENPVTENIKMALGSIAGVLPDQDHLAHIQVHMDFIASPMFGENPAIKPVIAAPWVQHMIQHMLMLYGSEVRDLIEKASGMKTKEFISDDPEVREALSKAAAAASPLALQQSEGLLQTVAQKVAEMQQFAQSLQPPPIMDPSQVAAKDVENRAQLGAQKNQIEQSKVNLQQQKIQTDFELADKKIAVDLVKNREDNETAMQITAAKLAEGKSSNLKTGTSIDQDYKTGGLVMKGNDNG